MATFSQAWPNPAETELVAGALHEFAAELEAPLGHLEGPGQVSLLARDIRNSLVRRTQFVHRVQVIGHTLGYVEHDIAALDDAVRCEAWACCPLYQVSRAPPVDRE
ncbi:hypothetical protein OV079_30450 [Nannocystis pusilla]|uniref:Uncharacterized protein n=1 Tax=Nannocystis pusilla TaxID=889268 RepID=A0A9X3IZR4_9BACT|nr:hypothetical protein [Nannocystis pusilla]MCY1009806.1 hypothetical protein [Nannocystis pusilla]